MWWTDSRCFCSPFLLAIRHHLQHLCVYIDDGSEYRNSILDYLKDDGFEKYPDIVDNFSKLSVTRQNFRIELFRNDRSAVGKIFNMASTTVELNFLSWNRAYSLFPYNTFVKKESFLLHNLPDVKQSHLQLLAKEGIKTKSVSRDQRRVDYDVFHSPKYEDVDNMTQRRCISDRATWVLDLDMGVLLPEPTHQVIETTTFRLHMPWKYHQGWEVAVYALDFDEIIRYPILKYQYVTLAEDTLDSAGFIYHNEYGERQRKSRCTHRCDELKSRLDELTCSSLPKFSLRRDLPNLHSSSMRQTGWSV